MATLEVSPRSRSAVSAAEATAAGDRPGRRTGARTPRLSGRPTPPDHDPLVPSAPRRWDYRAGRGAAPSRGGRAELGGGAAPGSVLARGEDRLEPRPGELHATDQGDRRVLARRGDRDGTVDGH